MEFTTSCDSVSFASEIQAMLHGFGDCRRPRLDTSIVIQSLVRSQMREILLEAANVARIRSSNQIQLEDVIFTVRSDPIRVQRIVKYLSAKDLSSGGGASATNNSKQGSRVRRVREILYTVDAEGGLLRRAADNDLQDASHLERQKRLERLSKDMDARQYAEFNRSRQVTFLGHKHRFSQKFCVWLTTDSTGKIILADDLVDMSIDQSGLEIFAYLAHELIGYLVDMALIIQKDESGITDPVRRIGNHSTFSPYMTANQNRDEKTQLPATWTGHGLVVCYSHYDTNAAFPEGASNEGAADVTCRPVEWQYPTVDLGLEAMFFTSDTTGEQFEIWAWDYHEGQDTIPYAECKGEAFWYRTNDLGGGFCTPNRDVNGQLSACGIAHCVGEITCYGC